MKPKIAILPLVDIQKESYWMLPGYMNGILEAGGLPVMLPLTRDPEALDEIAGSYDGFLFPGGQDVTPALYGQEKSEKCGETCEILDEMSKGLFERIFGTGKPILGICRGLQLLNVLLGGTLYQDLPTEHPSPVGHQMRKPYSAAAHQVEIVQDSPLYTLLGRTSLGVNSCHHQAVRDLSPQLRAMARSEDGLVEAAWMPGKQFLWAFQWHPEFFPKTDENSSRIFKAFVNACADA